MTRSVVEIDDIEIQETDEGLLLKYEWHLPIAENQRPFFLGFFLLWNGMLGLFALVGIAGVVFMPFFTDIKLADLVPMLLIFPIWFALIYLFYRVGRSMSATLKQGRPYFGWRLLINAEEWRSEYFEAWSQHDERLDPRSITNVSVDRKHRLVAEYSGKKTTLTTPLAQDTREWLSEKLADLVSASK